MSFLQYPRYKSTANLWCAAIPDHWDTWKISHAFGAIGSGTTPPSDEPKWYEDGTIPWVTTGELRENTIHETVKAVTCEALEKFRALRIYPAGSLAIAMYGATIGRLGILGVDAATNQACCVMSDPQALAVKFVFYWLQAFKKQLVDWYATGGGQPNVNQQIVASLRISAPSIAEQTAIAAFLDRETGKIDALIAEQEKLLTLLAEKRQATISHAVTRGINPNAPMKDSGIAWLGEVPEHWEVTRVKYAASHVVDCLHTTPTYDGELEFPAVRTADVERGRLVLDYARLVSREIYEERIQRLRPETDDILYTREGERFGLAALVPPGVDLCLGQRMMMFRLAPGYAPAYVMWVLNSDSVYQQVVSGITGATAPHVNISEVVNFHTPVPPLCEQHEIAAHILVSTSTLDRLAKEAARATLLLQERRSALIAAAVTGKIDVRNAVPQGEAA
ncbi:restriction endonuclease subunit S [Gluconobacter kondonii]|uniref:restriction endonuclease subunit S n=1 Tax=Gluconobacter kondonii TaxID=941463 RepID=UPI00209F2630|nr:restriction endonuclease subunit S [Gluconobacter kondonii]MCP1237848.1 restriction endonuclease subunit S [Gluconobacter kondonii]